MVVHLGGLILRRLRMWLWRRRVGVRATRWLGRAYLPSTSRIEIDLTWACNLRCFNCNRSCEQAPTGEQLSPADIRRFVQQSKRQGRQWERIRLLGGEPSLHPQLTEMLEELDRYRSVVPSVRIELVTNGHGSRVNAALQGLPAWLVVVNDNKSGPTQLFESFNVAPSDLPAFAGADFANACGVTSHCGIGLTPNGYYACAVAGGIDRIFGFDVARHELPEAGEQFTDQLRTLCAKCGSFKRHSPRITAPLSSTSWRIAYARYRRARPQLRPFQTEEARCRERS